MYAQIRRVLKPGGALAASDWLSGENADQDEAFQHYLSLVPLDYTMATARQTADVMREAGFESVETRDRNAWYAEMSPHEVAQIKGPLREKIIEVSDAETYEYWLGIRRALAAAAQSGGCALLTCADTIQELLTEAGDTRSAKH